ncbi:monoamine oxidase [Acrasis kona]|uniref:Amine oxidase n=1 Tax=Acrasis kona TaxID=1008807 RepID=A0AAW2Z7K3_9EUKA
MLKMLNIGTHKQFLKGRTVLFRNNRPITYEGIVPYKTNWFGLVDLQMAMWDIDKLANTIDLERPWSHKNAAKWDSMTVQNYMDTMYTGLGRDMIELFCQTVYSQEPSQISFLFLLLGIKSAGGVTNLVETEGGAQDSKIDGGAQQIPNKLLDHLNALNKSGPSGGSLFEIKYNHVASEITKIKTGYEVTTRDGSVFFCNYIIIAIPPTLCSHIHYNPPLPSMRTHLCQRIPMGSIIKVNMFFKTRFWRERNLAGSFVSASNDITEYPLTLGYDGTTICGLVSFFAGYSAVYWSGRPKEERIEASKKQYAIMFDVPLDFVNEQFLGYEEKDWTMDEFSTGAYSGVMAPGVLSIYGPALRTPIGDIHFAGTETAKHWLGYMSGAIESGERAASEVLEKIKNTN